MWLNNDLHVVIDSLLRREEKYTDGPYASVSVTGVFIDHLEVKGHSGDTEHVCVLFLFVLELLIDSNPMRGIMAIYHVVMVAVAEGFPQEQKERKNK